MLQIFNLLKRQPAHPSQVDKTDGIMPFGKANNFPSRLAQTVQDSPAASACISTLASFIEGNGFSDKDLTEKIINARGETFGQLHSQICETFAMFEGFALQVKYTKAATISEIYCIPFENVRLVIPDANGFISKVKVNPYFGTSNYEKKDTQEFDVFNPDKQVVASQIAKQGAKFKGQILYFGMTRPLSRYYPLPSYFSASAWMEVDAAIGKYHMNNLDAGFFQTVLMRRIGDPNMPSKHPDDQGKDENGNKQPIRTVGQRFEIDIQPMLGADSKTKMMVLWDQFKDQLTELLPFPAQPNDSFYQTLQTLTTQNIMIATKIPAILANMSKDNSLSDGTQMANATRVMHDRVAKPQNMLESVYKQVLTNFKEPFSGEVKIVNTNAFEELKEIDPLIWAEMTKEDRVKWIQENTGFNASIKMGDQQELDPLAVKLGVGGTSSFIEIINSPIDLITKRNLLAVLFGLKSDVIDSLLPINQQGIANKFSNVMFKDFPEGAKDSAKRALKFMQDHPGCGTPRGRKISQDIVEGKPMPFKEIKSIYNYLRRNRDKSDRLFSDSCEAVMFAAWGGNAMLEYCADKITFINE